MSFPINGIQVQSVDQQQEVWNGIQMTQQGLQQQPPQQFHWETQNTQETSNFQAQQVDQQQGDPQQYQQQHQQYLAQQQQQQQNYYALAPPFVGVPPHGMNPPDFSSFPYPPPYFPPQQQAPVSNMQYSNPLMHDPNMAAVQNWPPVPPPPMYSIHAPHNLYSLQGMGVPPPGEQPISQAEQQQYVDAGVEQSISTVNQFQLLQQYSHGSVGVGVGAVPTVVEVPLSQQQEINSMFNMHHQAVEEEKEEKKQGRLPNWLREEIGRQKLLEGNASSNMIAEGKGSKDSQEQEEIEMDLNSQDQGGPGTPNIDDVTQDISSKRSKWQEEDQQAAEEENLNLWIKKVMTSLLMGVTTDVIEQVAQECIREKLEEAGAVETSQRGKGDAGDESEEAEGALDLLGLTYDSDQDRNATTKVKQNDKVWIRTNNSPNTKWEIQEAGAAQDVVQKKVQNQQSSFQLEENNNTLKTETPNEDKYQKARNNKDLETNPQKTKAHSEKSGQVKGDITSKKEQEKQRRGRCFQSVEKVDSDKRVEQKKQRQVRTEESNKQANKQKVSRPRSRSRSRSREARKSKDRRRRSPSPYESNRAKRRHRSPRYYRKY